MPKSLLIELALSLSGVGLLVAVSFILGGWRNIRVTASKAADRLEFDEPDFKVMEWFVGVDGKSAAALSADKAEIALAFALGDSLSTRRLSRLSARIEQNGPELRFVLGEPSRRDVVVSALDEATARRWLLQLAAQGI